MNDLFFLIFYNLPEDTVMMQCSMILSTMLKACMWLPTRYSTNINVIIHVVALEATCNGNTCNDFQTTNFRQCKEKQKLLSELKRSNTPITEHFEIIGSQQ